MFNIENIKTIEERGIERTEPNPRVDRVERVDRKAEVETKAQSRIALLFLLVVLGILANWFWGVGWGYLADPSKGLSLGPVLAIVVRLILSFFAAALTFIPTYNKINQNTSESWVPYLLAFQNGFFWQAALDAIAKQF